MACDHTTFETRAGVQTFLASDGTTTYYQLTVEGRCAACQQPLLFHGLPVRPIAPPEVFMAVSVSADTQRVTLSAVLAAPAPAVFDADAGWQVVPSLEAREPDASPPAAQ